MSPSPRGVLGPHPGPALKNYTFLNKGRKKIKPHKTVHATERKREGRVTNRNFPQLRSSPAVPQSPFTCFLLHPPIHPPHRYLLPWLFSQPVLRAHFPHSHPIPVVLPLRCLQPCPLHVQLCPHDGAFLTGTTKPKGLRGPDDFSIPGLTPQCRLHPPWSCPTSQGMEGYSQQPEGFIFWEYKQ